MPALVGGRATVRSAPGRGTSVTVTVPVPAADARETSAAASTEAAERGSASPIQE